MVGFQGNRSLGLGEAVLQLLTPLLALWELEAEVGGSEQVGFC